MKDTYVVFANAQEVQNEKSITLVHKKCLTCNTLSRIEETITGAKFSDHDHYQCLGGVEYECLEGSAQYIILKPEEQWGLKKE